VLELKRPGNTGKTQGTAAFFVWCDAPEYDSSYA